MAHSILIIGGGAAGMVAGIAAARRGAQVRILERMSRVGRKLLATGNGRCNLTNRNPDPACYHGSCAGGFMTKVFHQFDVDRTLAFFRELGVEPRVEEGGLVYPASGQASSVLDVLRYELERLGVETLCDVNVGRVEPRGGGGIRCLATDGGHFDADRVIVACGGKSSPNLGSNGGGFKLAEALGHTVAEPFPALVPVTLDAPYLKQLDGVRADARATVCVDGQPRRAETGELQFTACGLSGVAMFQLSRIFSDPRNHGHELAVHVDLFPAVDAADLVAALAARFEASPGKTLEFSLVGLLHKKLIPAVLREAGLAEQRTQPCGTIDAEAVQRLATLMKDWQLRATGTQSWMHSQVTAGGVVADEVDGRTLESHRAPGVFFCGEVLDIDGDCGGFNLQWAWSSGHVAGVHAAGDMVAQGNP